MPSLGFLLALLLFGILLLVTRSFALSIIAWVVICLLLVWAGAIAGL